MTDPHSTPFNTSPWEPPAGPFNPPHPTWNPADPYQDPHDQPFTTGPLVTGPYAPNIVGGPLDDGRTANVKE